MHQLMDTTRRLARDQRGASIVLVALCMAVMLGMAALAIDIGMVLTVRTEAQRAADSGAMAGAWEYIQGEDEDAARDEAIQYAGLNSVLGDGPVVLPEDVEIDTDAGVVRVTVRRTADRGSPVPTWFARVFGVDEVDVTAVAAAGIFQAHGGVCLKPWAIIDGYLDVDGDGYYTDGVDTYDGYEYGTEAGSNHRNANDCCYEQDVGREIMLKPGSPSQAIQPGWYFPWRMPLPDGSTSSGADDYRENIVTCNTAPVYVGDGTEYDSETGNMPIPTVKAVEELIAMDPGAEYDPESNTVINSAHEQSPRIVYIPLIEPTYDLQQGMKPLEFTNIIGLFLVETQGRNVVGKLMFANGIPSGEGVPGEGIKYVSLIE